MNRLFPGSSILTSTLFLATAPHFGLANLPPQPGVMLHAYNPNTQETKAGKLFEGSLGSLASLRLAWPINNTLSLK